MWPWTISENLLGRPGYSDHMQGNAGAKGLMRLYSQSFLLDNLLTNTRNLQHSLKVLAQQVKWSAHSFQGRKFWLQDDGTPCHRSKITVIKFVTDQGWKTVYTSHRTSIQLKISGLCSRKKSDTNTLPPQWNSTQKSSIWHHNIQQDLLEQLALSMTDYLWAVIKAHGGALCRWGRCFVADQLWLMTRIREEEDGGATKY